MLCETNKAQARHVVETPLKAGFVPDHVGTRPRDLICYQVSGLRERVERRLPRDLVTQFSAHYVASFPLAFSLSSSPDCKDASATCITTCVVISSLSAARLISSSHIVFAPFGGWFNKDTSVFVECKEVKQRQRKQAKQHKKPPSRELVFYLFLG
jgi:hypothetical protein